jgi:very-short-patch-repair endonuclease
MDRTSGPFQAVLQFGLKQHAVFSTGQAKELGVDHRALYRAVVTGKLSRDLPNVYRIPGPEVTWESRLMAAQLWLGRPDGAISHRSAAALWGLPGFQRGSIELSTTRWKKPLPPVVVHRVVSDIRGHTTTVGPIRVTNAGWTLLDLAGLASADILEAGIEDAIRRGLTSVAHLRWLSRGRKGKSAKGIRTLRRILDEGGNRPTESHFETRLLQALRKAPLPLPQRQFEIRDAGRLIARVDFAYPWAKVVVEADSYRFHSGREAWESDLDRRSAITALGWLVIHVTYRQMESGMDQVVRRVRDAITPRLPEARTSRK